jgi:hypothetical protein
MAVSDDRRTEHGDRPDDEERIGMSEPVDEQLSAMLDGELPPEQSELLLKRLDRDAELRARFGRYALISESLRGGADAAPTRALFIARVHASIAASPPLPAPARVQPGWRLAAGLAVAATVAGLAVVLLGRAPGGPELATLAPPAAMVAAPLPASDPHPAGSARLAGAGSYVTPPLRARPTLIPLGELANYAVAHSDFAASLPTGAMLTGLMVEEPLDSETPGPAPPKGGNPP